MAKILIPDSIWGQQNFSMDFTPLEEFLENVPNYHQMQFSGKLMNQTGKNEKKSNFGPDFGPLGQSLGPKITIFFAGFASTSS